MPLALKILMKSQHPDGTWSTPSPFVLDPHTGSGVYVANLEIANAVLRIIRNTQPYEYFPNMKRIYTVAPTSTMRVAGWKKPSTLSANWTLMFGVFTAGG